MGDADASSAKDLLRLFIWGVFVYFTGLLLECS